MQVDPRDLSRAHARVPSHAPTSRARLTARDVDVLLTLFQCRIATYAHLAVLHFGGSLEAAKKRGRKLTVGGWLAVRTRAINRPIVLSLTDQSLGMLHEFGALQRFPRLARQDMHKRRQVSQATLDHELAVMDVRCVFHSGLVAAGYEILTFSTWPLLHSFFARPKPHARDLLIRPDGYLAIRPPPSPRNRSPDSTFFLEIDRGTETLQTLITRCACYRDFYRRGGLALWHGDDAHNYQRHPFRVLIVTTSDERRNNLAEQLMCLHPPVRGQVLLTVQQDAERDPLGPIWITPADFAAAVRGTEFEERSQSPHATYRRSVARESLIASRIDSRQLF